MKAGDPCPAFTSSPPAPMLHAAESAILPPMALQSRYSSRIFAITAIALAATIPGSAQSRATVTVEDYQRAEKFMNYNTAPLILNGPVRATWLPGDRFWYRNQGANGSEFFLVDAVKGTKAPVSGAAITDGEYTVDIKGGVPIGTHKVEFHEFAVDPKRDPTLPPLLVEHNILPPKFNRDSKYEFTAEGGEPMTKDYDLDYEHKP